MSRTSDGAQVKVFLPMPLYQFLRREAGLTGRTMAEIVREELAGRYHEDVVEFGEGGHRATEQSGAGIPALQVG